VSVHSTAETVVLRRTLREVRLAGNSVRFIGARSFDQSRTCAANQYLRVNDATRVEFQALGAPPFTYGTRTRKVSVARYYELPDEIAEDGDALLVWMTNSFRIAATAKASSWRTK
jgi:hypothetical protein